MCIALYAVFASAGADHRQLGNVEILQKLLVRPHRGDWSDSDDRSTCIIYLTTGRLTLVPIRHRAGTTARLPPAPVCHSAGHHGTGDRPPVDNDLQLYCLWGPPSTWTAPLSGGGSGLIAQALHIPLSSLTSSPSSSPPCWPHRFAAVPGAGMVMLVIVLSRSVSLPTSWPSGWHHPAIDRP